MPLHAPDQVQILKQRERAASANRIVSSPPDENARIAVAQSKPSQVGINGSHLPGGVVFALKNQRKVPADNGIVAERVLNGFQRSGFRPRIRVDEPKDIAYCHGCRSSKLASTAAFAP